VLVSILQPFESDHQLFRPRRRGAPDMNVQPFRRSGRCRRHIARPRSPIFGLVIPSSSRNTQSKGMSGTTSTWCLIPLTISSTMPASPFAMLSSSLPEPPSNTHLVRMGKRDGMRAAAADERAGPFRSVRAPHWPAPHPDAMSVMPVSPQRSQQRHVWRPVELHGRSVNDRSDRHRPPPPVVIG